MRKLVGLLVAVAACGDDGVHHLADAPPTADARVDGAPGIDAAPLPVTITVTKDSAPLPNVKVYFQAPDSTEISSTTTDATGVASAFMPNGGFVTALDPFPLPSFLGNHTLKTFANVKAGDHLVLTGVINATTIGTGVTFNLPADAATPYQYNVYSTCGHSQTYYTPPVSGGQLVAASVSFPATLYGCGATTDFLVVTVDSNYKALDFFTATGVAVVDQGTVDLSANVYAPVPQKTFNVLNIATPFTTLYYYLTVATPTLSTSTDLYANMPVTTGSASGLIGVPTVPGSLLVEDLEGSTNYSYHDAYRWGQAPETDGSYKYDATNRFLAEFSTYPAFDQPTNALSWTAGVGSTPDLYAAHFQITRNEDNGSGGTFSSYIDWRIVGAYSGAAIKPPTLPSDAAIYNPLAADGFNVYDVTLAKVPGGYDAVRAHLLDVYEHAYLAALVAGASGHLELESASQGGKVGPHHHAKRR